MAELPRTTNKKASPPSPPPLPASGPRRGGVFQRIAEIAGLGVPSRPPSRSRARPSSYNLSGDELQRIHSHQPLPSQTTVHRTGIPIAALDINNDKTCAVLAGKEILKIIRFEEGTITEDVNLRSKSISSNTAAEEIAKKRRDFLPATDVKWSTGNFKNFIATAANHGRIAIYDVSRADVERAWVHEHTGPVHKLAFDPHIGALLLSGSHDGSVKMWDLRALTRASQTMRSACGFLSKKSGIRDVKWCPTQATDALEFALGTDTGVIQKWDLRKPNQPLLSINAHIKACLSVDWHPDGKHLVSGGLDKLVKVWDFHIDKGNQKAQFELKTPQAVRNVRWRPPCWSSEFTGSGQWQCTQLATSYHQDDPRLHIWDLRRQHIPFREIERYRNAATDFLWATKDLIWTVGDEGWFTQTDVGYARLIHHSLAPGAVTWFPDGRYGAFSEMIGPRRGSGYEDPEVGFLSVPPEKLSSGEDIAAGNSFSDDEAVDGLFPGIPKQRQSRSVSEKAAKSQTNTPPASNGFPAVLSLDKAIPDDMFDNKQVGMVGHVTGLVTDSEVASYLAESYARHSTDRERRADPGTILERLEAAFTLNADVCDDVSMHRTAQSWRMLSSVIIPELRHWAESNRAERLQEAEKRKESELQNARESKKNTPHVVSSPRESFEKKIQDEREEKLKGSLFRGVFDAERANALHEVDSTSNVTTPMARPLPDSPLSASSPGDRFQPLDETLERLPQLPPSVLASHQAAATASRALREENRSALNKQLSPSVSSDSETPPLRSKHRRAESSQSLRSLQNLSPSTNRPSIQSQALLSSPLTLRPTAKVPASQRQDERRAALRDYQKPTRTILTFDEPISSPSLDGGILPQAFGDSSSQASSGQQVFPLFSTSNSSREATEEGSGHYLRPSPGQDESFERGVSVDGGDLGAQQDHGGTHPAAGATVISSMREAGNIIGRGKRKEEREQEAYDLAQRYGVDGTRDDFRFVLDGSFESREERRIASSDDGAKAWENWNEEDHARYAREQKERGIESSLSSSPHDPFQFDHELPVTRREAPQPREYHVNPFLREDAISTSLKGQEFSEALIDNVEELSSAEFIYNDFRPIDLTTYNPPTPFSWSALPLIAQAMAFDLDTGPACAQFSAHLLAHVHPYFFHQSYRSSPTLEIITELEAYGVADRLMHPSLNRRMFEQIFLEHDRYLKTSGLFVQMAECRKLCVEFGYAHLYGEDQEAVETGLASATPYHLSLTCGNSSCRAPMRNGEAACRRCNTVRSVCPICLSLAYEADVNVLTGVGCEEVQVQALKQDSGLWAYCHGCGHSAHMGCLEAWLAHPFSEGECPTSNCGHDCGPGKARVGRIAAQDEAEERRSSRTSPSGGIEGDRWKLSPSPAVERTRKSLRGVEERGTQSGDESGRSRSSFGNRSGGAVPLAGARTRGRGSLSGQAGQGPRKSVRLVTPHEEAERSMAME